jgi:hypothetical protein
VIRPQEGPPFGVGGNRKQVTQGDRAASGAKRCLQDVGVGKVPSLGIERTGRSDSEAAADLRVEQRSK